MGKKIKVGVFGAYRGMTMIDVLLGHPDADLTAICDKYQPLLDKCRKKLEENSIKAALYSNFDDFFNHDMDAVVLANYATEHAPFAIRLLESGRHVCSEVMPVETLAQAVQLTEAVEKSGMVYTYSENYCYFPATQEMRRRYLTGDLGEFTHGEGEYVHDCENIWGDITYGERNHWRNRLYSCYYCSHSLGPILTITDTRPVRVVGFETPNAPNLWQLGFPGGTSGLLVMQMDNGATVKSLNGYLKREPSSVWYAIYGRRGMMESDRWQQGVQRVHLFQEGSELTEQDIAYTPKPAVDTVLSRSIDSHGGGDFYTMHYFLEKILGRKDGERCIDIYQALDMSLPGILGYRSILNGNMPYEIPDLRQKDIREKYRNDNACTNPIVAGDMLLPCCSFPTAPIPNEVFEKVARTWEKSQSGKA